MVPMSEYYIAQPELVYIKYFTFPAEVCFYRWWFSCFLTWCCENNLETSTTTLPWPYLTYAFATSLTDRSNSDLAKHEMFTEFCRIKSSVHPSSFCL